jgi:hypothetical protein
MDRMTSGDAQYALAVLGFILIMVATFTRVDCAANQYEDAPPKWTIWAYWFAAACLATPLINLFIKAIMG